MFQDCIVYHVYTCACVYAFFCLPRIVLDLVLYLKEKVNLGTKLGTQFEMVPALKCR